MKEATHNLYYKVGGHNFCVNTTNTKATNSLLLSCQPFRLSEKPEEDLLFTLTIVNNADNMPPRVKEVGQFDCGGCNHGVYLSDDGSYQIEVNDFRDYLCCKIHALADFSKVEVCLYGNTYQQRYGLNNALMMAYAFASADKKTVLMHASVVRKDGKGYLCLGVSGTGKSTHTSLWLKHIEGTDLINDDNPVVRIDNDGTPIVYGTPWSGKTPCYRNVQAPVGGFLQLKQAPYNKIEKQNTLYSIVSLLPSCSSMKWDTRCNNGVLDTIRAILQQVPTYRLECLPDEAACRLSCDTLTHHDA